MSNSLKAKRMCGCISKCPRLQQRALLLEPDQVDKHLQGRCLVRAKFLRSTRYTIILDLLQGQFDPLIIRTQPSGRRSPGAFNAV